METEPFRVAVDELVAGARGAPTAVMCSESLWWRCHRRLLADHLVLVRGIEVTHVMQDSTMTPHTPTTGVWLANGGLVYDVGVTAPLPVV